MLNKELIINPNQQEKEYLISGTLNWDYENDGFPNYTNVTNTEILFPDGNIYTVIDIGTTHRYNYHIEITFDKPLPDIPFNVEFKIIEPSEILFWIEGSKFKPVYAFTDYLNKISFRDSAEETSFEKIALYNGSSYRVSSNGLEFQSVPPEYDGKKITFSFKFLKSCSWDK